MDHQTDTDAQIQRRGVLVVVDVDFGATDPAPVHHAAQLRLGVGEAAVGLQARQACQPDVGRLEARHAGSDERLMTDHTAPAHGWSLPKAPCDGPSFVFGA
ncbi:hypothetical protein D3C71_1855180 [compost metagenome]